MSYATSNELKEVLTSVLELKNLNQTLINQLLSDDFINGAYELIKNEPENDEFMNFARNFSETQNLKSIMDAKNKFAEELGKDGYLSSVFQYVIDAWRNVDFSVTEQSLMRVSNNEEDYIKPETIFQAATAIAQLIPPLKAAAQEANIYKKIAEAVYEQDKKFYQIADNFEKELGKVARGDLNKLFGTAEVTRSPLVIDLDGDGVETLGTDANIHFDHDGNGFAENTGWASPDDAILVRDINNNSSTLLVA